jgi:hypothetical protein
MPGVEEKASAFDVFEPFRDMRDAYLDSMSKMMTDAVNTEGYAQATGAMLDYYLAVSAPFREAVEKSLLQALQQLSLPSREEFALLAERFTNLEMIVDDLDKKLDRISSRVSERQQPAELPEKLEARLDSMTESLKAISKSVSALVEEKQRIAAAEEKQAKHVAEEKQAKPAAEEKHMKPAAEEKQEKPAAGVKALPKTK